MNNRAVFSRLRRISVMSIQSNYLLFALSNKREERITNVIKLIPITDDHPKASDGPSHCDNAPTKAIPIGNIPIPRAIAPIALPRMFGSAKVTVIVVCIVAKPAVPKPTTSKNIIPS